MSRYFTSDNASGVCPEVMVALAEANVGHCTPYGNDELTREAKEMIRRALGRDPQVYFVFNGTAANTLAAKAVLRSIDSIICPDSAHIVANEVGAPTSATGCKMIILPASDGKVTPEQIRRTHGDESWWGMHATRPKLVSISQSTEWGTVYTLEELSAIKGVCQELGMWLHVDGCRLYNAAAALDCSLADICQHVDILSLGGTKNGLMFGEAVVFFDPQAADGFLHVRKQGLQLNSKMRFVAAQFKALFTDQLWKKNAAHANAMAKRLAEGLEPCEGIALSCPVQTNQIFLSMPGPLAEALRKVADFYPNGPLPESYRMVTSFDTTKEDVERFVQQAQALCPQKRA